MKGYGCLVREVLLEGGFWFLRHGEGDHDVWRSPRIEAPFTISMNIDSRHTANLMLKDAGLPKAF